MTKQKSGLLISNLSLPLILLKISGGKSDIEEPVNSFLASNNFCPLSSADMSKSGLLILNLILPLKQLKISGDKSDMGEPVNP